MTFVIGDGESGLQVWEARRHALVILDITLPSTLGDRGSRDHAGRLIGTNRSLC
ncbi:MAG: hypothetical protein ACREV1_10250 [Gammaproteobacteria bacterium]